MQPTAGDNRCTILATEAATLEYGDQRGTQSISRRNFLNLAVGAGAAAALAACGSSGPGSSSSGGGDAAGAATYWSLSGPPGEAIRKAAIDRFNKANPDSKISADVLPERRLQAEDQDRDRRRPGAHA